jgi:ketosteroid isomerase-like protein
MSTEKNVQAVKEFFAAIGRGDKEGLLALVAEDIEWIIPGVDWPLAGTHRGREGVAHAFQKAAAEVPFSYPAPPEYVAQGDRVLVIGFAKGKITATNRTFEDNFVFDITMRDGKLKKIREYIDTQALARAAKVDASGAA